MRLRAWSGYLFAATAVSAAYFWLPRAELGHLLLYNGVGLSALIATVVGIRVNRPSDRRAWSYIAAGQAMFLAGDVCFYVLERQNQTAPFPSAADALYLCMYPLVILGLRRLVAQVSPGRDWTSLVDAAVMAVAVAALFGVLVIDRYLSDPTLSVLARVISIAYPVMDIALVAIAARVVTSVRLGRSGILLLAGLCGLLTADLIYGILNSAGAFTTGGVADAFWLGFYVLVAAAALHPDMSRPVQGRRQPLGMTRPGVVALCLATLSVPIMDLIWGRPADRLFTTSCSCAVFLLVTTRLVTMVGVIQSQERQARHHSLHDALTGLPNRVLFVQQLQEFAEKNPHQQAAVLFIDLDGFKQVNDTLGHDIGDQLLVAVGQRLIAAVRDHDLVARLSGDEFAILLRHVSGPAEAVTIADRIHAHLAVPIALASHTLTTTASIGISTQPCATFPGTEAILKAADTAMYQAKATGKGRHSLLPTPPSALLPTQ